MPSVRSGPVARPAFQSADGDHPPARCRSGPLRDLPAPAGAIGRGADGRDHGALVVIPMNRGWVHAQTGQVEREVVEMRQTLTEAPRRDQEPAHPPERLPGGGARPCRAGGRGAAGAGGSAGRAGARRRTFRRAGAAPAEGGTCCCSGSHPRPWSHRLGGTRERRRHDSGAPSRWRGGRGPSRGSYAPRRAWRGFCGSRAGATRRARCWPRSMAGSPKDSTRWTCRRPRPCSTRCAEEKVHTQPCSGRAAQARPERPDPSGAWRRAPT